MGNLSPGFQTNHTIILLHHSIQSSIYFQIACYHLKAVAFFTNRTRVVFFIFSSILWDEEVEQLIWKSSWFTPGSPKFNFGSSESKYNRVVMAANNCNPNYWGTVVVVNWILKGWWSQLFRKGAALTCSESSKWGKTIKRD